jgi:hypothetical protein
MADTLLLLLLILYQALPQTWANLVPNKQLGNRSYLPSSDDKAEILRGPDWLTSARPAHSAVKSQTLHCSPAWTVTIQSSDPGLLPQPCKLWILPCIQASVLPTLKHCDSVTPTVTLGGDKRMPCMHIWIIKEKWKKKIKLCQTVTRGMKTET